MQASKTNTLILKRANLLLLTFAVVFSFITSAVNATPISGTKTVGSGGNYPNLTTAFADITANGLSGTLTLQLIAGYPASAETYPLQVPNATATSNFQVAIYPTVAGLSITSSNTTGTLNFNGSKNVTIDGRVNMTGFTTNLIIGNTNVGGSYAIQFINDATSCTVNRCNVKSRNNSITSGTIVFGTTTGANGNDNNTISNSGIGDDGSGSYPVNAIYSVGTTTTTAQYNSSNIINGNLIYNFFSATKATNGIFIGDGNSSWSIYNGSFYQTATRTYTAGNTHTAININCPLGYGFDIESNSIGGSSEGAGGTAYTIAGNVPSIFRGILLNVSPLTFSWINANQVSNIAFTTTSASFNNPGIFAGIAVLEGMAVVGSDVFGNTIGASTGTSSITINELTNFSARIMGIYAGSSAKVTIKHNNIGSIRSGNISGQIIYGIVADGTGDCDIIFNTIGSTTTANSITSGVASLTVPSEAHGIWFGGSGANINITSNTIKNLTTASGLTAFPSSSVGIYCNPSGTQSVTNISNNIVSDIKANTPDGALSGIWFGGKTGSIANNNQIFSIGFPATSGSANAQINGFYDTDAFGDGIPVTNNQVYNLYMNGTNTNTANWITAMTINNGINRPISGNSIHDITFTNSSTGSALLTGIGLLSTGVNVFKNKIYNLTASNGSLSKVNGIQIGFYSANVYNNLISGLSASASSLAPVPSVVGLNAFQGDSLNAYNNSINISGSGGTNFGSAAVYFALGLGSLNLANNIFSNTSTASGTGKTVALQWENNSVNNSYQNKSDNNLFYAGTAGANNLIFYDGTNADQTIVAFKTRMATRDQSSVTENPNFLSTTGSNANFLHINTTTTTLIEGGGTPVSNVTDDYDADTRNTDTPDIGADEFAGIGVARIKINSVSITPNGNQCTTTNRTVTANVTAGANNITSVNLVYTFAGGTAVVVPMTGGTITAGSASAWTAAIPASVPANAKVEWAVKAQDALGTKTKNGASYKDEPLTGFITTASASASPICSGTSTNLSVIMSGVSTPLGDGSTTLGFQTSGGYSPFGQYYEAEHAQYLITAADLVASGLNAGNIISLAFNVTQKFSTLPYTSYTIKLSSTTTTSLSGILSGSFTQVYQSATAVGTGYSPVAGINTFTFGTGTGSSAAFNWDGSSNLIVDICFANDPSSTGTYYSWSDVVSATTKSYTAVYSLYNDNTDYCAVTTGEFDASSANLPVITFTGNTTITPSAVSWSNATGIIGTTNPLTVVPATTTTYTVSATDPASACPATATVTVTVNHTTGAISGGAVYCTGSVSPTTLNIAVTGTGPWNGTLSDGTPFSGNTSPIPVNVTPLSTFTYTIATLNDGTCAATPADLDGSATITINPLPATATITPNGSTTFCAGDSVLLTSSSATGNQWNLEGSPIAGQTNQTLTVTAGGNYSVTVSNGSCSTTSLVTSVTVNPTPATPTITPNGPTTFCSGGSVILTSSSATGNQWNLEDSPINGETNQTLAVTATGNYSVTVSNGTCSTTSATIVITANNSLPTPTVNIVQPTCAVATATVTVTSPTGTGITYSLDGNVQTSTTFNQVASGSHLLTVQNSSGCSSTTSITVNLQPTVPSAPVVTGIINVCPYVGTNTQLTYIASSPGATSYTWTLPPNVNIVSGAGTATIIVTFPNMIYNDQGNRQFRVRATSACGTSSQTIFYTYPQSPMSPHTIVASSTSVCQAMGSGTTITYTIPKVLAATRYEWSAQANTTTINHLNGPGENDTTINISFSSDFTTSDLTVMALNNCGASGTRSYSIIRDIPAPPGPISGPNNACPYINPGAPAVYSVTAKPGMNYNWSIPAGALNVSGQGSNSISFTYPAGYTGGSISVTATNECGTGGSRSLQITTFMPGTPNIIDVINTASCPNRTFTYSIGSYPTNTGSLVWTIPTAAGAILISGQNTATITVSYPPTSVQGIVTVQAINNCSNSAIRSVQVRLPACPPEITFAKNSKAIPLVKSTGMEVKLFPNPTTTDTKLEVITASRDKISVRVLDPGGRSIKQLTLLPYQPANFGSELKAGIYMIEVTQAEKVKTMKLIKF